MKVSNYARVPNSKWLWPQHKRDTQKIEKQKQNVQKMLLATSSISTTRIFKKIIYCLILSILRGFFYDFAVFILKLINRHWMRDNMMLKHIIYVSIFYIHTSLCALLMLVIQHSSVCMLGSFCMRLLNNVWLNVACVTLCRQKKVWERIKVINFSIPLRVLQPRNSLFFFMLGAF